MIFDGRWPDEPRVQHRRTGHPIGRLRVRTKIDATHPGLARVWVSFGYVGGRGRHRAAHATCQRSCRTGRPYRVHFAVRCRTPLLLDGARAQQHQQRPAARSIVRASSDLKDPQYVDISVRPHARRSTTLRNQPRGVPLMAYTSTHSTRWSRARQGRTPA